MSAGHSVFPLANYHTHTIFCDGADTPAQLAEAALAQGLTTLGFSGHSYTWFDPSYCMGPPSTAAYRLEVQQLAQAYQGRLTILCGVEQDLYSDASLDGYDYVLGAMHYVCRDGFYLPVDDGRNLQTHQVRQYWDGDYLAYCEDYYSQLAALAELPQVRVVAHLDLVSKFNQAGDLFDEQAPRYLNAAFAAIDRLLAAGMLFELNSGAMARGLRDTPYPGPALRRYIADRGGRFLPGSDCHDKAKLTYAFDRLRQLAQAEGLTLVDSPLA